MGHSPDAPGAGPGWRDNTLILGEYLRTKGAIADPPAQSTRDGDAP